jgi:hypothetical protein
MDKATLIATITVGVCAPIGLTVVFWILGIGKDKDKPPTQK